MSLRTHPKPPSREGRCPDHSTARARFDCTACRKTRRERAYRGRPAPDALGDDQTAARARERRLAAQNLVLVGQTEWHFHFWRRVVQSPPTDDAPERPAEMPRALSELWLTRAWEQLARDAMGRFAGPHDVPRGWCAELWGDDQVRAQPAADPAYLEACHACHTQRLERLGRCSGPASWDADYWPWRTLNEAAMRCEAAGVGWVLREALEDWARKGDSRELGPLLQRWRQHELLQGVWAACERMGLDNFAHEVRSWVERSLQQLPWPRERSAILLGPPAPRAG